MRVRVVVTVDVDPGEWSAVYGDDPGEVRTRVREYVANQLLCSEAVVEGACDVRIAS